ncbi:MAG: metallophosphoesterase [Myxococcota bacterium]
MIRRLVVLIGTLLMGAGCVPGPAPEPEPAVVSAGAVSPLPRTWTDKERAEARDKLRERVSAAAFAEAVAPASLEYRPTGRAEYTYEAFFSSGGAVDSRDRPEERIEIHDLILKAPPLASLDSSSALIVDFETLMPVRSAKLYVGSFVAGELFRKPVFRARVDYELQAPTTRHRIEFAIRKLLSSKYDIQNVSASGRGVIAFRLEVQVPGFVDSGRTRPGRVYVEDGRIAFRCSGVPCALSEPLIQLPTISLGPMVDLVTAQSATVSWLTSTPTVGRVIVRDSAGLQLSFDDSVAASRHEVKIDSLRPGEAYRYLALSCDERGECVDEAAGTFRTPHPAGSRFRFALMSDSRASSGTPMSSYLGVNREVIEQLFAVATQREIDFAIFAGDLITGYVTFEAEYRRQIMAWQEATEPFAMHLPIYEGIGNHEFLGDAWAKGWIAGRREGDTAETVFAELVVNPKNSPAPRDGEPSLEETVFSFDRGVGHFAVLNSNYFMRNYFHREDHPARDRGGYREGWVSDEQLAWLDADLAAARTRGAKHLFVFTHEPAFPNGGHVKDAMWYNGKIPEVLERRDAFLQILLRHKVLAVFFGDEHNYSRTRIDRSLDPKYDGTLWQIISGGAGAPYYAQNRSVPWVNNVEAFEPVHHVVIVDVNGDDVWLRALTTQGETIDEVELTADR